MGIASRFGVTVNELLRINSMSEAQAAQLRPGQELRVPGGAGTSYIVQPGDTFVGIALRFNISTEALMQANGLTIEDARTLRPGQELRIPAPGTVVTSRQPTATPTPIVQRYTVRPGDTVIGIARRFNVTSRNLLAANGMTADDARRIRPGDVLLIPAPGQNIPTPTPTGGPASPGAGQSTTVDYRLDPPLLEDPEPGVNVSCSGDHFITWKRVAGMAPGDEYVLFLGYVNTPGETVTDRDIVWVLEQRTDQRTDWKMNNGLCNLAPQSYGRRWRWYVQVFAGDTPVSPPSDQREFTWR